MKWAIAAPLAGLALMLGGCAVVPLDAGPGYYDDGYGPAYDARYNTPYDARYDAGYGYGPAYYPAYGARRVDGLDLAYDSRLSVYLVAGYPDLYWWDNHYYRLRGSYWEWSPRRAGPWTTCRVERVPRGLRDHHRFDRRGSGTGYSHEPRRDWGSGRTRDIRDYGDRRDRRERPVLRDDRQRSSPLSTQRNRTERQSPQRTVAPGWIGDRLRGTNEAATATETPVLRRNVVPNPAPRSEPSQDRFFQRLRALPRNAAPAPRTGSRRDQAPVLQRSLRPAAVQAPPRTLTAPQAAPARSSAAPKGKLPWNREVRKAGQDRGRATGSTAAESLIPARDGNSGRPGWRIFNR